MMMEEDINSPVEINRSLTVTEKSAQTSLPSVQLTCTYRMKQTRFIDLSKKRKLQAEQQSMPLPKHICSNRSLECNSEPRAKEVSPSPTRGNETDTESAKDNSSFTRDSDSVMPISGESKSDLGSPKTFSSDQPSTSSVSWDSFKNSLYSLESRSLTKSSSSKVVSISDFSGEHDCSHHNIGLHPSLSYEEHLLELEYRIDGIGNYKDKELEDMLYSNDVAPSSYVLSSGRWTVNRDADTQPGTKKLTIDKEFEQYFSMLML